MVESDKCQYKKANKRLIGCEGTCNKWYHFSCLGLNEQEYLLLDNNSNIFYFEMVVKKAAEWFIRNLPKI